MSTIFEKIIAREIPAHFVYEDDQCAVIMDRFPAVSGQTLIISKEPIDYFADMDDALYQHMFAVAKRVAKALDKAFGTIRTCLVIEGLDVPHVHIRLYPITEPKLDIRPGGEADDEILAEQAEQIKEALEVLEN